MASEEQIISALTALDAVSTPTPSFPPDGRASFMSDASAVTRSTVTRVGRKYGLLALPRGAEGVVAARALVEISLLPMADEYAVADQQRSSARKALVGAVVVLEGLAKGQAVKVAPVAFEVYPGVREWLEETGDSGGIDAFEDKYGEDLQVLNGMQELVAIWGREIERVVGAAQDGPGVPLPAEEEQLFWISVDAAFESGQRVMDSDVAVIRSLQLLARKRRVAAFGSDACEALLRGRERAQGILHLVRSLPVGPVRTADDVPGLTVAIRALLNHVTSKLRLSSFPLNRALALVMTVSQDVSVCLSKILLRSGGLLAQSHNACLTTVQRCDALFAAWDDGFEMCRTTAVKRAVSSGEKIEERPAPAFTALQARLRDVASFRIGHGLLLAVVEAVEMGSEGGGGGRGAMDAQMGAAYDAVADSFGGSAVTDVSAEGESAWSEYMTAYSAAVFPLEQELADAWQEQMVASKTLKEKAFVGARFGVVVDRPSFSQCIQSFMPALTALAKGELVLLREKFALLSAPPSSNTKDGFSNSLGLPPISIRAMSLYRLIGSATSIVAHVSSIVGVARMETDFDLRDLQADCERLKDEMDPAKLVVSWVASVDANALAAPSSLFTALKSSGVDLSLTRDSAIVSQELVLIGELGYAGLVTKPVADFSLQFEAVRTAYQLFAEGVSGYAQGAASLVTLDEENPTASHRVKRLLRVQRKTMRLLFEEGSVMNWTFPPEILNSYAMRLKSAACAFSDAVVVAVDLDLQVEIAMTKVEKLSCLVERGGLVGEENLATLQSLLRVIARSVEDMSTCKEFSSVVSWYQKRYCRPRLLATIRRLLSQSIDNWTRVFLDGQLCIETVTVSSSADNGHIQCIPSLDRIEQRLYDSLFAVVDKICLQEHCPLNLRSIGKHGESKEALRRATGEIQIALGEAQLVVDKWRGYEGIWSLDSVSIPASSGENLERWSRLLTDVRSTQARIKTQVDGPQKLGITVNICPAAKGAFQLVSSFAGTLSKRCAAIVEEERNSVYHLTSETLTVVRKAGSGDALDGLLVLKFVNTDVLPPCEKKMVHLEALSVAVSATGSSAISEKSVDYETAAASLKALRTEFDQRWRHACSDMPALEAKLQAETDSFELELADLYTDVSKHKDESGDSDDAEGVLKDLVVMEKRLEQSNEKCVRLGKVALALDLPEISSELELDTLAAELSEMRVALTELTTIQAEYDIAASTRLGSVEPKKLRVSLESQSERLRDLQDASGGLALASKLEKVIGDHLRVHYLVSSLRTAKLSSPRERELLEKMFGRDGDESGLYNVSLGALWGCGLHEHDRYLKGVFESAAGESSLATFLATLAEAWTSRRVEFVARGRVYLIRGIPLLIDDANEHLQALSAMGGSSHARLFESERASWELRIANLRDEVEVWAEVQLRWLHLSSLFADSSPSSGGLRRELRQEYASFKSVQARLGEFSSRAKAAPGILEVLEKPSGLDRMSVELAAVVRGLGKFLESQRSKFPRLFYLSDEDLLLVLSISQSNVEDLAPHLSKLFPGVARLVHTRDVSSEKLSITAVVSKEGEFVKLSKPVVISPKTQVVFWLRALELELEQSLRLVFPGAVASVKSMIYSGDADFKPADFTDVLVNVPAQVLLLAMKVGFTSITESAMQMGGTDIGSLSSAVQSSLQRVTELDPGTTKPRHLLKFVQVREQVIKELVYQRTVLRSLREGDTVHGMDHFSWFGQLRFYVCRKAKDEADNFTVEARMADSIVTCGWEYHGVGETLVQTPLTQRCFLTLTQALKRGLGGAPFGPAGTGKTESVKALGRMLGRAVAVFNCDETFDAVSVGRILAGVCRTGSWVCFDEFNRLAAGILSSTSSQLAILQSAIQMDGGSVPNFYGDSGRINVVPGVAVFVTMNPTYSGRRELPGNLTSLFRPMAMTKPDSIVISEVSLLAQGFKAADILSPKLVGCFEGLARALPSRPHYDFGLRSLKSAVVAAGVVLRCKGGSITDPSGGECEVEEASIVQALLETVKPKIIPADVALFESELKSAFPGSNFRLGPLPAGLLAAIDAVAKESGVALNGSLLEKIGQLYKILEYRPGVMLVGPTGSAKTTAWQLLRKGMMRRRPASEDGLKSVESAETLRGSVSCHVFDPKLLLSSELYGSLDVTTREWTDGIFTKMLRQLSAAPSGEKDTSRSTVYDWIVFDGDVDPDWAENLNSVLDDSRVLTLATGERIALPASVRLIFETESVKYANPSTISRCGMVCFSANDTLPAVAERLARSISLRGPTFLFCMQEVSSIVPIITELVHGVELYHDCVMPVSPLGLLETLFALFGAGVARLLEFEKLSHEDSEEDASPFVEDDYWLAEKARGRFKVAKAFALRNFLVSSASALCGSLGRESKSKLSNEILSRLKSVLPTETLFLLKALPEGCLLTDVYVDIQSGEYVSFSSTLDDSPLKDLNPLRVGDPDIVIPTATTVRNCKTLAELIRGRCDPMVILCGPPGCGKSMVIGDALSSMANVDLAAMSFSSTTSPADILATLRAHTSVQRLAGGELCLRPKTPGSRVVLFCDEVNLVAPDSYGTQKAAAFLRQLLEHGGFWGEEPMSWIRVEGLQIVAACNPPELAGRQSLPNRLVRHSFVMRVEAPAGDDLNTIFGALNSSLLYAINSAFASQSSALTGAMIDVYEANQSRFAPEESGPVQPHYVYSPRDMSRWLRGMRHILLERGLAENMIGGGREGSNVISPASPGSMRVFASVQADVDNTLPDGSISWSDVVSALVHEARRLFVDRLMLPEEREYSESALCSALTKHLGFRKGSLPDQWYSAWPKRYLRRTDNSESSGTGFSYEAVDDIKTLRKLVYRKLRAFCEEEGLGGAWMNGSEATGGGQSMIDQFAVTDDVLRHLTRIERVLRLPLGHAVLVGVPGSGKKTLARFAAWMGGLSVHQVRSHAGYTADHFADDLRGVLRIAGVSGNPVMMIFDESNALDGAFLEMMNAILACGDVPGLFDGESRSALLSSLRKQNIAATGASTDEALYKSFVNRVRMNLHVVFTLSCDSRKAFTNSSDAEAVPVGKELLSRSPALYNRCVVNWMGDWDTDTLEAVADLKIEVLAGEEFDSVVKAAVQMHDVAGEALAACPGAARFVTPRHYLEFMEQVNRIFPEKVDENTGGLRRLHTGLQRLKSAGAEVDVLKAALAVKSEHLVTKEAEANETLTSMAEEQRRAEQAKVESQALALEAEEKANEADARKADVADLLAEVEPKVEAARSAVGAIRKENLEELRAMPNPPAGVRVALEAVIMLLNAAKSGSSSSNLKPTWQEIRKRMRGTDLIPSVVDFDPEAIPSALVKKLHNFILKNKDFDAAKIAYSSKAAGPLAQWTLASLEFAEVNESIAPLREEADELCDEQDRCLLLKEEAEASVDELRLRIDECRAQYASLVSEAESVRREIGEAEGKLVIAESLVESLASEWNRWKSEFRAINAKAVFVLGNSVIGAAFVSYAGVLDGAARMALVTKWRSILAGVDLEAEHGISYGEFLSSPGERTSWTQAGLAMDETSLQSYAILKRSARYPLIIDPSRQIDAAVRSVVLSIRTSKGTGLEAGVSSSPATRIIGADKTALNKTSFAATGKNSYLRVIESAMRFGTAVLLEDAEQFDYSVAPVLGQEATTGSIGDGASVESGSTNSSLGEAVGASHRLVRLGDRDVDQNPSFRLFLTATNLVATPAAVVSRCCVVSFIFSESNLQSRCLSRCLYFIVPDLERQRAELIAARLDYAQKKFALEEKLLSAIAVTADNSEGMLEGSLMTTLDSIKKETGEMEMKMAAREQITADVDRVTALYTPLASFAVEVFCLLSHLSNLNTLYQFSADYFLHLFESSAKAACASGACNTGSIDNVDMVSCIKEALVSSVFLSVCPSLFPEDQIPLAASLATLLHAGAKANAEVNRALEIILLANVDYDGMESDFESAGSAVSHEDYSSKDIPELISYIASSCSGKPGSLTSLMGELSGRIRSGRESLVQSESTKSDHALREEILSYKESRKGYSKGAETLNLFVHPLLLCTRGSGVDPSALATSYCRDLGVHCESVAIGDSESLAVTRSAFEFTSSNWGPASKGGVLLFTNMHLAPVECIDLIRREISKHRKGLPYVLMLATEVSEKGSLDDGIASLATECRVLAFEAPCDFRSTFSRSLSIGRCFTDSNALVVRLLITVVWLHASVLERCRYAPTGMKKQYNFADTDLGAARDLVMSLFGSYGGGNASADVLTSILADSVYGGRLETPEDSGVVREMIRGLVDRAISSVSQDSLRVIDGTDGCDPVDLPLLKNSFRGAIEDLPAMAPAKWFGLDKSAELARSTRSGAEGAHRLASMFLRK